MPYGAVFDVPECDAHCIVLENCAGQSHCVWLLITSEACTAFADLYLLYSLNVQSCF